MEKKKTVLIACIVIVIATIILIVALTMHKDKQTAKTNMEAINKNYQLLTENVTAYNEIRNEYTELSSVLIMKEYDKKHETITALLNNYDEVIKKIDDNISNINLRCNIIYSDAEVNNICNNYKVLYEKIVNLYVNDLAQYNNFIEEYNEYKKTNLLTHEMVHKEYIDYDQNNVYEGSNNHASN